MIDDRWGHEGGALMTELAPLQKKHQRALSFFPCTYKEEVMWAHSNMVAVYKPGRELSPAPNPGGILISSLQNMKNKISAIPAIQPMVFCYSHSS